MEEKKRTGAAQNGSETLTQVGWDSEKTEVNENRFVTKGSNVKSCPVTMFYVNDTGTSFTLHLLTFERQQQFNILRLK